MKKKSKRINNDYLIVNLAILVFFIIGLIYILISKETLTCYYKENFDIECRTCGLTRDFKSILKFKTIDLINPLSVSYFKSITVLFGSRLIAIGLTFKKNRNILIFEIIILFLILTQFY